MAPDSVLVCTIYIKSQYLLFSPIFMKNRNPPHQKRARRILCEAGIERTSVDSEQLLHEVGISDHARAVDVLLDVSLVATGDADDSLFMERNTPVLKHH